MSEMALISRKTLADGSVTPGKVAAASQDHNVSGTASRRWLPTGAKMENFPRHAATIANNSAITSGTLRLSPLGLLRAGDSLSSVTFSCATTAAVTPTNQWAGIVRFSDRNLLAVSPDATTGAWAAGAAKTFTFGSAYSPGTDTLLWACLNVTASTVPSLATVISINTALGSPVISGNANTAQTVPLAVGTIIDAPTASGPMPYCYAS